MDAQALLSRQGWRGTGHSLHKTDDTIGLAKPLLLNRKDNTKGLGQKQHFTSDQWWMNAFDEQLKGLDTSKEGQVTQTITTGKLNSIEKGSLGKWALYTSFVRGGFLEGTLSANDDDDDGDSDSTSDNAGSQQKMADAAKRVAASRIETKEERRARKEEKRKRKELRAARREAKAEKRASAEAALALVTAKAERRARKEERRKRKMEKASRKS